MFREQEPLIKALNHHPESNMAFTLGPEKDSPVCAVDIDGKAGQDRARELGVSSKEAVWVARTGSGNFHVVYRYPDDAELPRAVRAGKLPLDLLTNGYLVVEPSITAHPYRWLPGHSPRDISVSELYPPPKPLLEWWLSLDRGTQQDEAAPPVTTGPLRVGERNSSLASLAGTMRKRGMSAAAIAAALHAENAARCDPPLSAREVDAIAKSVGRYAPAPPRARPQPRHRHGDLVVSEVEL